MTNEPPLTPTEQEVSDRLDRHVDRLFEIEDIEDVIDYVDEMPSLDAVFVVVSVISRAEDPKAEYDGFRYAIMQRLLRTAAME